MTAQQNYGAHSAQVKMRLLVRGQSLRITHMGPDFIILDAPEDYSPCQASISLQVDGGLSQWAVRLPFGISKDSKRVALALPDDV